MAAENASSSEWESPSFEPIIEAVSALAKEAVLWPVEYRISFALDGETLELTAEVHVVARTVKESSRLPLLLCRQLRIDQASINGEASPIERAEDLVWLSAASPVPGDEEVTLRLSYRGHLPTAYVIREREGLWIELAPQAFWYPVVRWDLTQLFRFRVDARLPKEVAAAGNGDLIETSEGECSTTYVWEKKAGYLGIAVLAGPYVVRSFSARRFEVQYYARPDMVGCLGELSDETSSIAAFYTERLGALPGREFKVVIPPHSAGGNWALPNMIVASLMSAHGDPLRRVSILTHEIAHQWWGHSVRFDFMSEIWLPEALTEFSGLSARLHLKGEATTLVHIEERTVQSYERARGAHIALADCKPDSPHSEDIRENAGAVFLSQLRLRIGAAEFDRRLRGFYKKYQGDIATTSDFVTAMTETGPEETRAFIERWLYQPDPPQVSAEQILAGLR